MHAVWTDLYQLVRARIWRIAAVAVATAGLAALYAFLSPPWYEAEISVVQAPSQKGGGMSGMAAALASDLSFDLNLGGSDAERIQAVLRSRSMTDAVIEKFDLIHRYKDKFIDDARKSLWKHCSTKIERKPGIVTVTCEDKDPAVVQQMANFFAEYGNLVFRRLSASSAAEERRFLETRVEDTKTAVAHASQKLREFEEKNKLIDLGEQSRAVVSAIAKMRGEELSKQIELSYLNSFSSSDEVTSQQLRQQLSVIESKMRGLEEDKAPAAEDGRPAPTKAGSAKKAADTGLFPTAMSVPRLRYELTALYREQKIQETLLVLLTQRFEMAKVNEARDTSTFSVVDYAVVPHRRSRPRRMPLVAGGGFVGVILGLGWLLVENRRRLLAPRPPAA